VAAAVGVATAAVGVARARVAVAVAVGTLAVVAVAVGTLTVAGGTLAVVGVVPLPEQAATIASRPPMRAALVILVRASGCPIIWTPPVGTHAESSEDKDRAASIAPWEPPPNGVAAALRQRVRLSTRLEQLKK
jgi:hypothetical protein